MAGALVSRTSSVTVVRPRPFGPAQQLIEQSIGDALAAVCRKNRHISDAALIQYIFHAKVAKRFPFPLR